MKRRLQLPTLLLLAALAALSGCRSVRSDLSEPLTWTELADEPVVVVKGEKVLPVVAADTPENRWAAMFLADTIEEMCGRRPKVLMLLPGQSSAIAEGLFIGDANGGGAASTNHSFRVVARGGCVRFLGKPDYAVFDWCERALGLRYYCADGKCVERRDEIVVPAVDYSDAPVFEHRTIGGHADWTRVAKTGSTHRGGVHVHAPHAWNRDARLKAEHPEIFETGETPMLCYGNPATLEYYKTRIDRHIAGLEDSGGIVDTARKVVTVCQWDAPIKCKCRWCRSLYSHAGKKAGFASPVIWGWFMSELNAWMRVRHPDYLISFLPYLNTVEVPAGGMGDLKGCEAEVCTMPGLAMLKNQACRESEEGVLRAWRAATGRKVLNWHYECWPKEWTSAPLVFGRTVQRHYSAMRDVSCGSFVCGGANDPRTALSVYVWMKCLWNPAVDVEAIYDGFAKRMFGPAARPMRALIALQEDCWERQWADDDCSYRNIFEVSFPPDDVARMKSLLQEAYAVAVAAGDETAARRVAWYAGGMRAFFAEAAAERGGVAELRAGETREMALASRVGVRPWAKTRVTVEEGSAADGGGEVVFVVRCEEPAAGKMDFTRHADDFVRDDDYVLFVVEDGGRVAKAKVYKDGVREGDSGFEAKVAHDATGWTVTARAKISAAAFSAGKVRGNVSRLRVGDMRLPKERRVPGSRYEHSRLGTRFTQRDTDPAAFVEFRLR